MVCQITIQRYNPRTTKMSETVRKRPISSHFVRQCPLFNALPCLTKRPHEKISESNLKAKRNKFSKMKREMA